MVFVAPPPPARRVYFSFHFDRDIRRVQVVKNHAVHKGGYRAGGFFDGSLKELAKKESSQAVKRAINSGIEGSSVTCVLIGQETYTRDWVDYEIFKSVERGMGVFGVRIHGIRDAAFKTVDPSGANPFHYLAYAQSTPNGNMLPYRKLTGGWTQFEEGASINRNAAKYIPANGEFFLERVFSVYDWVLDDGYNNFQSWVAEAARKAGK
jgi:hypothetical protein